LFNQPVFPELLRCELLVIVVAELLHAGCPSYHPTNIVRELKDDSVLDWVQHAAVMDKEFSSGCVAFPSGFKSIS